jgi:hypothetical protein
MAVTCSPIRYISLLLPIIAATYSSIGTLSFFLFISLYRFRNRKALRCYAGNFLDKVYYIEMDRREISGKRAGKEVER